MNYIFFASIVLATTGQLSAEVTLQPSGLEPGDRYRLLFVTSESRDALSHDIDDYNNFVQSVADAAPVVGPWGLTWKALASTDTVDARDNTGTNPALGSHTSVVRIDGALIADSYESFYSTGGDTATNVSLDVTELGSTLMIDLGPTLSSPGAPVWTGTSFDGTALSNGELGDDGTNFVALGFANFSLDPALLADFQPPGNSYSLYAVSQVLTAVPEPETSLLVAICICILTLLRSSRRFY